MKKKHVYLLLRLSISIGLIAYFVYTLALKQGGLAAAAVKFQDAFAGASLLWLLPALLLHPLGFCLASLRWKVLLKAQGAESSFKELFAYYFMAAFFNSFLPSTIGGDTVRVVESKKLTGSTTTSLMVVLIERLTGLTALVLISSLGLCLKISTAASQHSVWIFLGAVSLTFLVVIVCAHPRVTPYILKFSARFLPAKIQDFLVRAHEATAVYYKKPAALLGAIGISVVFQLNMVLYYYLIAVGLHQNPDPVSFLVMVPVMIFLLMTVPAINGLGVRTAGFKGLMKFPAANALAMEFVDLAFRLVIGMLGGIVFLFYRKNKK